MYSIVLKMMLYIFFIIFVKCMNAEDILVTIPNGNIKGRVEYSLRKNLTFYAFQQIPYGKPPIRELRFKDPQPADSWDGTLDATKNEKICYQISAASLSGETEDCLFLNVYIPNYPSATNLHPVIVYIHGGGFIIGSSTFDEEGPHYFMENEVILVTINYRLGPFGFLSTGDMISPGNQALKDQTLGLKWVSTNIKYFGGDPKKVTIMGQSAGASSVTYHLMSKRSENLFRGVIACSGSFLTPWSYQTNPRSQAKQLAITIDATFNPNATSEELLAFLRNATAVQIKDAAKSFPQNIDNYNIVQGFFWAPTIEPVHADAFFTEPMYFALERGKISRVPLLIGINSEEALGGAGFPYFKSFVEAFDADVKKLVNKNMHIQDNDTLEIVGNQIRKIYTDALMQDNLANGVRYYSDMSFTRSIIRHAYMQSIFSDVFFYQFSYDGKLGGPKTYIEGAEKVTHSEEGSYLWAYRNNSNLDTYPVEDVLTSDRFRTLLTNFAKYLNPTPGPSVILQNVTWPRVTRCDFKYLNINTSLTIEHNPKNSTYRKWQKLYNNYTVRPFINY